MEMPGQRRSQAIVRSVQEDIGVAAFLDPIGDFFYPRAEEGVIGLQLRMADEAHLWVLAEGRRAWWYLGLLRLRMQHGRVARGAAEQRPRVQADALHAAFVQQAVEQAFFFTLGEEGLVTHFHGHRQADLVEEVAKLAQARRAELGRQLQPVRRNALAQRGHQPREVEGRLQLITQVTLVADVPGKLGGETEVPGHHLRPAGNGAGSGACIEGGIALDGVEHLAVEAKHFVTGGVGGIEVVAPGVFAPGRATEKIRQWWWTHPLNVQVEPQYFHVPVGETGGAQVAGQGSGGAPVTGAGEDHVLLAGWQATAAAAGGGLHGGALAVFNQLGIINGLVTRRCLARGALDRVGLRRETVDTHGMSTQDQ